MSRLAFRSVLFGLGLACGPVRSSQGASESALSSQLIDRGSTSARDLSLNCEDEPGMNYIPGGHHRQRNIDYKWREIEVSPFWLDRYEVTVADFRRCVAAGACVAPYPATSGYTSADLRPLVCTWSMDGAERLPVNCVDMEHVNAYCSWAAKRSPLSYEWTWAVQGREWGRKYPWGDGPASCEIAIVDTDPSDDVRGCGRGHPWPVGSRPQDVTRDGVYDMAGNVGELTQLSFPEEFPVDIPLGQEGCGSAWTLRPYDHGLDSCAFSVAKAYSDNSGFRCAKDPGPLRPCTVAD